MSKYVKLIFLIHGTNRFSTFWEVEDAYEDEAKANQKAEQLRIEEPDKRFKVTQLPLHLKHK